MHNPVLAIGWSLWARHRVGHAVVLAAIPFCALFYRLLRGWIPPHLLATHNLMHELPLTILPMALSLVWVLYVFAQTEDDPTKGFTGFPIRMFALPVRPSFLVLCHMGYGSAAILLVHLAWVWFVFEPLGVPFALRWPLLLLVLAMVSFQAVVWGLASFPWIRAAAIGAGGLFLGPLIAVASGPEVGLIRREPLYALWTLGALPFVVGAALVVVGVERLGGWQPAEPLWRLAHRLLDALLLRRRAFESPQAALTWLEWRRKGWLTTAWLSCCIAGAFTLLPVLTAFGMRGFPPWLGVIMLLPWPIFIGGMLGGFLARPDLSGPVILPPFHALKPISDAEIVLIKFQVAAGVAGAGWLLSVPLTWWISSWSRWQEIWIGGDRQALAGWSIDNFWCLAALVLLTVVMTWRAMLETISLGLTGNSRLITVYSVVGVGLLVGLAGLALWHFQHPQWLGRHQAWAYFGIVLWMVVKLRAFFRSFAEVRRRALVSPEQFRILLALWFGMALSVVGGTTLLWLNLSLPGLLLLGGAAWLWPAGELAQAIVNFSANRHR